MTLNDIMDEIEASKTAELEKAKLKAEEPQTEALETEELNTEEPEPQKEKTTTKVVTSCFEWVEALVTSLVAVVLIFTFLFRIMNVSGTSMLPNLQENDRVLISSWFYTPKQGDVVVITRTRKLEKPIIKRIIATEGQTVDIDFEQGIVYVDGEPLDESAYIENGITTQFSDYDYPQTVPEGNIFVLGDNRPVSDDSRSNDVGMVDCRYILGKVRLIVFPFNHFGTIKGVR